MKAASVQPSAQRSAIMDGQRIDVMVDVWNVTGHALDVLAHVRDPVEKKI